MSFAFIWQKKMMRSSFPVRKQDNSYNAKMEIFSMDGIDVIKSIIFFVILHYSSFPAI